MEVVKTNSIILQKPNFTSNNKPVKLFQMQKIQNSATQIAPSKLSPAYFHPSFGTNLQPLKKAISLAETAPRSHSIRGDRLKEFYNNAGVPYLLRHEVWSDKKITRTIKLFGKELDKLAASKTLDKETLQETVNNLVPEAKGKIVIKDFSDLENDLRVAGYPEENIELHLKSAAITCMNKNGCNLYFNFEKAKASLEGIVKLKIYIEHELTHALRYNLQNTTSTDMYKNAYFAGFKENAIFNKIFMLFERQFTPKISLEQSEITKKNLLKHLDVYSIKTLHNDFECNLYVITGMERAFGNFNIGSKPKYWKQFFAYLKHIAREEKEAYKSNRRYREIYADPSTPTNAELTPLLYAEMEKFFAKKERMAVEGKIPNIS